MVTRFDGSSLRSSSSSRSRVAMPPWSGLSSGVLMVCLMCRGRPRRRAGAGARRLGRRPQVDFGELHQAVRRAARTAIEPIAMPTASTHDADGRGRPTAPCPWRSSPCSASQPHHSTGARQDEAPSITPPCASALHRRSCAAAAGRGSRPGATPRRARPPTRCSTGRGPTGTAPRRRR